MHQELNLFFDQKESKYYFTNQDKVCEHCKKPIINLILIKRIIDRFGNKELFYCYNCIKECRKMNRKYDYEEITTALIVDYVPKTAYPIIRKNNAQVETVKSNISVFDIHGIEEKFGSHRTIDNTKHAGRFSLEGAKIGDESYIEHNKKLDTPILSVDEGLKLIDEIAKRPVAIEGKEEVKRIERDTSD